MAAAAASRAARIRAVTARHEHRSRSLVSLLASLAAVLAVVVIAFASPASAAGTRVRANTPVAEHRVGAAQRVAADQVGRLRPPAVRFVSATGVATEEGEGLSEAFHYTGSQNVASIEANGLRAGSYATPNGQLSPLQAQIDLALPPNRGLPGATLQIDVAGLRDAGYEIPEVTPVGRSFNMPGGGSEIQFPYPIPPEFIKVVP
jgi:hypothetical protein